jgi:hypothetical protein
MGKGLTQTLFQRQYIKHMKWVHERCSSRLAFREMKIKVLWRYHFTSTKMVIIRKMLTCVGEEEEKL